MNECYLCGIQLESLIDQTTSNHEEHIIPQAIGGQLTVKGILCKECGGEKYLGGQIDKPFSNMFLLITERLDIKRDRKTRPVALTGKPKVFKDDREVDVNLREGILAHRRPDYTVDHVKKSVRIFANKIVAKEYKRKVEREVRENIENSFSLICFLKFKERVKRFCQEFTLRKVVVLLFLINLPGDLFKIVFHFLEITNQLIGQSIHFFKS